MKKILLFIAVCSLSIVLYAGDIEKVSATYEYTSNDPNETPAQVEAKAFATPTRLFRFPQMARPQADGRRSYIRSHLRHLYPKRR